MAIFNSILNKIFEIILFPFKSLGAWSGMIIVSLLTGMLMLQIFKYMSNQAGIRRVKNTIKAYLLELRLYKDSLRTSLKAQGQIVKANLKYMGYSIKPLLAMIIPLVLILIQLNFWFAYDALDPGQSALLKVKLEESFALLETSVDLRATSVVAVETPGLRIEGSQEINWRIRAMEEGDHEIVLSISGEEFSKKISVGKKKLGRISPLKTKRNFWKQLIYPTEFPFPKNSPIRSVEIIYPQRSMVFFGLRIHWLIVYLSLSIILGFSLKGFFGVEI